MCLYKAHRYPKISSKPIKVWKIVKVKYGNLYAPYRWGICYHSNIIRCASKFPIISGILNSYIESEGVHAYTDLEIAKKEKQSLGDDHKYQIFEAEIPPFTPYWVGTFRGKRGNPEEIAATKIKLLTDKQFE